MLHPTMVLAESFLWYGPVYSSTFKRFLSHAISARHHVTSGALISGGLPIVSNNNEGVYLRTALLSASYSISSIAKF